MAHLPTKVVAVVKEPVLIIDFYCNLGFLLNAFHNVVCICYF